MELVIISPVRRIFSGETSEVSFPGELGRFTVLRGHAPIIASLQEGDITFVSGGRETSVHIMSGCVKVQDDRIEACVEIDDIK